MRLIVNGEPREVAVSTLQELLEALDYQSKTIATALNGEFIHKHLRADTELTEDDRIEIVAPIEGG